jgi:hypothetical protein
VVRDIESEGAAGCWAGAELSAVPERLTACVVRLDPFAGDDKVSGCASCAPFFALLLILLLLLLLLLLPVAAATSLAMRADGL